MARRWVIGLFALLLPIQSIAVEPSTVVGVGVWVYGVVKSLNVYQTRHLPYFELTDDGDRKFAELATDWGVGDCIMQSGARVEFFRDGTVRFRGWGYTRKSYSGDVWHGYFNVADGDGYRVYRNRDQFRMPERGDLPVCRDGGCAVWVDETQHFDPDYFNDLYSISFEGGC